MQVSIEQCAHLPAEEEKCWAADEQTPEDINTGDDDFLYPAYVPPGEEDNDDDDDDEEEEEVEEVHFMNEIYSKCVHFQDFTAMISASAGRTSQSEAFKQANIDYYPSTGKYDSK